MTPLIRSSGRAFGGRGQSPLGASSRRLWTLRRGGQAGVGRRLVLGGRIDQHLTGAATRPIGAALNVAVMAMVDRQPSA